MILRDNVVLEVLIGEEEFVKIESNSKNNIEDTGTGWTIIPITEKELGKDIMISVENIYENTTGNIEVYIGDNRQILWRILKEGVLDTFVCIILLFISISMCIVGKLEVGGGSKSRRVYYLAYFCICLAIWRIPGIDILKLFIPMDTIWSNIRYISISFTPVTFMMYFATCFNKTDSKLIDAFCKINLATIIIQVVGHASGVLEFRQSLWITQIIIILAICIIGYFYSKEVLVNSNIKNDNSIKALGVLVLSFLVGIMWNIVTRSNTIIPVLATLIYIFVLAVEKVRGMKVRTLKISQLEVYEKLAFLDEMTGLYNRTALEYDFNKYNENIRNSSGNISRLAIIIIDINNLKYCNDKLGHDKGDIFIKTVSNAIIEAFCDECKCYRMGGDEFCVIYENATLEGIQEKAKEMRTKVDRANKNNTTFKYNYALGYEWYDHNIDNILQDTLKRADDKMYQTKRIMKSLNS